MSGTMSGTKVRHQTFSFVLRHSHPALLVCMYTPVLDRWSLGATGSRYRMHMPCGIIHRVTSSTSTKTVLIPI